MSNSRKKNRLSQFDRGRSVKDMSQKLGEVAEWEKWHRKIPAIKFPSHWNVKIVPPYGGTIVRFEIIRNKMKPISVYLDGYSALGYRGAKPYWEVWPVGAEEDNPCCGLNDIPKLLRLISKALRE